MSLQRFGVSMKEELLGKLDRLVDEKGYSSRSEAIRDMVRQQLVLAEWEDREAEVAGTITLLYDHEVEGLCDGLTSLQHQYHDAIMATMHLHLDHHHCLEVLIVKGRAGRLQKLADELAHRKGVKHGKLTVSSTGKELA